MTTATREAMYQRIEAHGRDLLAIFPDATERDPVKLCKKLRRLESSGRSLALRLCNGPEYAEGEAWEHKERILSKVHALLNYSNHEDVEGFVPVFLNGDPRGYALKIDDEFVREHALKIHTDWGGYGIIAPDLTEG